MVLVLGDPTYYEVWGAVVAISYVWDPVGGDVGRKTGRRVRAE